MVDISKMVIEIDMGRLFHLGYSMFGDETHEFLECAADATFWGTPHSIPCEEPDSHDGAGATVSSEASVHSMVPGTSLSYPRLR